MPPRAPHPPRRPELLLGLDQGLGASGRIRREGDLGRVAPVFEPLVTQAEAALRAEFGTRLHSLYLYGSVPRGTAVEGRSDLDVSVVLHDQVDPGDRTRAAALAAELDRSSAVVDGVGILVDSRALFLAPAERFDGAFHVSCLCTPLWGPDLAAELLDQRPTRELAHGIGRGTEAALVRLADQLAADGDLQVLRRAVGRRLARLAFTTVLARWPGWTSDPATMSRVVSAYYPDRVGELARNVELGWGHLGGEALRQAQGTEGRTQGTKGRAQGTEGRARGTEGRAQGTRGQLEGTEDERDELLDLVRTAGSEWLAEHRRVTGTA